MKQLLILVVWSGLLLTACGGTPTPDLEATAQAAVASTQAAQPTDTPTPMPTDTPTPRDTPLPPTATPIPPTETPIPPTETPNPLEKEAVIALLRAVNGQDIESALTLFSEDAEVIFEGTSYKGKERIREWLGTEVDFDVHYKSSKYGMSGDNITWSWIASWTTTTGGTGQDHCEGEATISDGEIRYLKYHHCK